MNFYEKYSMAIGQLICLYVFLIFGIIWGLLFTDFFEYSTKDAWWAIVLRSFSVLTIPTTMLVFMGMTFPPLPVEVDKITDWKTQVVIRWTTRGIYPTLVQDVVRKSHEALKKYKNIRFEVVTETSVSIIEKCSDITEAIFQEMIIPATYKCPNGSLFKARGLDYGAKYSRCDPDAYIVHLDEESVMNENLFLGVRQFLSEHNGFIGQGIITYANVNNNWQSYICHMADAMRTGDDFARFRLQTMIGRILIGMKGSFMIVPNFLEQTIGFDHGQHASITEDAWFAFSNWDKIRFCRGILEEQSPFTIFDAVKQRRRWATGLWLVIIYHPCSWWKKSLMSAQMLSWILSPFVVFSFLASFVLYEYRMPTPLAICLGFNFAMFNFQYIWGCLFQIHGSWWSKILHMMAIPFMLPFFMCLEAVGGVYGTFFPMKGFQLVSKETDSQNISSAAQRVDTAIDIPNA